MILRLSPHCLWLLLELILLSFIHPKREMTSGDVGNVLLSAQWQ